MAKREKEIENMRKIIKKEHRLKIAQQIIDNPENSEYLLKKFIEE